MARRRRACAGTDADGAATARPAAPSRLGCALRAACCACWPNRSTCAGASLFLLSAPAPPALPTHNHHHRPDACSEKDIPIDMLELPNKSEKILQFAWEPRGSRFAVLHGEGARPTGGRAAAWRRLRARRRPSILGRQQPATSLARH